jgi:hypothetical protein
MSDKHVSIEMDSWKPTRCATRFRGYEYLTNTSLDTVTLYKKRTELSEFRSIPCGYTSTVTLRVVGGDGKASLKTETVKYDRESEGTWTGERLRWQGPAVCTNDRPVFSSERALHKNKTVTLKQ